MKKKYAIKYLKDASKILCYYVDGNPDSTETLFFLNGLYHGPDVWVKQQRNAFIKNHYKLIFMDYRGFGRSIYKSKERYDFDSIVHDIRAIIIEENIQHCHFIAYSIGGMFALRFAYQYKIFVKKLILLNTSVAYNPILIKVISGVLDLIHEGASFENILSLVYPWHHSMEYYEKAFDLDSSIRKNYAEYISDLTSFELFIKALLKKPDLRPILSTIDIPCLVVSSDEDVIFPPLYQEEIASKLVNSSYRCIKHCGHATFIEKFKEVNRMIIDFLSLDGSAS